MGKIEKAYPELSSYDDIVDALYDQIERRKEAETKYLQKLNEWRKTSKGENESHDKPTMSKVEKSLGKQYFINRDKLIESDSVPLCDTPDFLKEMGFDSKFVYDLSHFEANMESKNTCIAHAHGLSPKDMKKLPDVIEKPFAILTSPEQTAPSGGNYKPLVFLYANPTEKDEYGRQVYRKAVVSPRDFDKAIFNPGPAAKVITYYNATPRQVIGDLTSVIDKEQNLLYFDRQAYDKIKDINDFPTIEENDIQKSIKGSYAPISGLRTKILTHMKNVQFASIKEIEQFAEKKFLQNGTVYLPFKNALDLVRQSRPSLDDLSLARNLFDKTIETASKSPMFDIKMSNHARDMFAKQFNNKLLDLALREISKIEIKNDSMLDKVFDIGDGFIAMKMEDGCPLFKKEINDLISEKVEQYDLAQMHMEENQYNQDMGTTFEIGGY